MNFAKRTHDVVTGKITQYRQPVGEPRRVKRPGPRGLERTGRSAERWQHPSVPEVGKVFKVKPAEQHPDTGAITSPAVHAEITRVDREWLGQITFGDARAEGHRTTDDFKVAWVRRVDRAEVNRSEAWALRELGEDGLREALLARFTRRHAAIEVWVVTFAICEGKSLFLAAGAGGDERGYTATPGLALDPDAECVDDVVLARYAKKAEAEANANRAKLHAEIEAERSARRKKRLSMFRDAA